MAEGKDLLQDEQINTLKSDVKQIKQDVDARCTKTSEKIEKKMEEISRSIEKAYSTFVPNKIFYWVLGGVFSLLIIVTSMNVTSMNKLADSITQLNIEVAKIQTVIKNNYFDDVKKRIEKLEEKQ